MYRPTPIEVSLWREEKLREAEYRRLQSRISRASLASAAKHGTDRVPRMFALRSGARA